MADREDIIDLAVRYAWALDSKNVDGLRDVFTADATAMLRGVECHGVDQIIARIGGSILRLDHTQHFISNHQIVVDGDTATHRCQLQSQHVRAGVDGGNNFIVGGYYDDRVVRTPDGWRIAHRLMRQTWTEGNPAVVKKD
ncbi:MAG TPA: nuclear transport factor 2 family protein [Ilumatobacteraceae bacterium]|nr:nuclear transport factor 2 family protein [Ilumatobacteraceae bacterium]